MPAKNAVCVCDFYWDFGRTGRNISEIYLLSLFFTQKIKEKLRDYRAE